MGLTPTSKSVIGTFINGRNGQDDFLQIQENNGGSIIGWIDANGILQGSLASSATGIGGSILGTQVAVGTGANVIGGTNSFTFSAGTVTAPTFSGTTFSGTTANITTINGTNINGTIFNAVTGFQIGSVALSGQFLRGNGTNFVSSGIQPGDVVWNQIGSATGNLTLANGTNSTTFNQTSSAVWTWANTTASTGITLGQNSPQLQLSGTVWNGSSSVTDTWQIISTPLFNVATSGATANLTIKHTAGAVGAATSLTIDSGTIGSLFAQINCALGATAVQTLTQSASSGDGQVLTATSVGNASGGLTIYQISISAGQQTPAVNAFYTVAGFTNAGNNGRFQVNAATSSTLTLYNSGGIAETHAATATADNIFVTGLNGAAIWRFVGAGGATFSLLGSSVTIQQLNSALPGNISLALAMEQNSLDAGYHRIINTQAINGNHGYEIGAVIDGTGAAPVRLQLGVFGGSTGAFINGIQLGQIICSGQIALSTGAINSGTRATNTLSCTGLSAVTDSISCTFSGDTNAVTGYAPSASGGLTLKTWVSANTINVDQVNNTGSSITPGAATLNCKGLR